MRYGFVFPSGSIEEILEWSAQAEAAGWDAVFVWEGVYALDAWVTLAAIATRTQRLQLGTMLTPLPWRRPWKVASEVMTLDRLSGGRAILAVGMGAVTAPDDDQLGFRGDPTDIATRAERMDEGIDLLLGLWSGQPVDHRGTHYTVHAPAGTRPVQDPVPLWIVGAWNRPKSMRRVLRGTGLVPMVMRDPSPDDEGPSWRPTEPADVAAIAQWAAAARPDGPPLDIVVEGETPADDPAAAAATARAMAEAGATWWIEAMWTTAGEGGANIPARIAAGPPGA